MTDENRERDPYLFLDAPVLRNKLNIKDAAKLDRRERLLATQRTRDGIPPGDFDLAHLRKIHRHLFQDVYDWAGEVRTVEIAKNGNTFQLRDFISTGMADIHRRLVDANFLRGLSADNFATAAGRKRHEAELERLRLLEAVFDLGTRACLRATGLHEGWRCLEVGAGAGHVATWFCEAAGPSGRVLAVDLNESIQLPKPEKFGTAAESASLAAGPGATTPDDNPYMPTRDIGSIAICSIHMPSSALGIGTPRPSSIARGSRSSAIVIRGAPASR